MIHNTTVEQHTFSQLKEKQRYLVIKHNPLFMPGDTLTVSLDDSREQLSFEVVAIEIINSRYDLLALYAPYSQAAPAPETEVRFH